MKKMTGIRKWLSLCLVWAMLFTSCALGAAAENTQIEAESVETEAEEVELMLGGDETEEPEEPEEPFVEEIVETVEEPWDYTPRATDDGIETITISKNEKLTLDIGDKRYIAVNTGAVTEWTSTKPAVAEVTFDGELALVNPLAAGSTTLKAKVGTKTISVTLTVVDPTIPTGIELTLPADLKIDYNEPVELAYTLLPEGKAQGSVEWKVAPAKLAMVEDDKLVPLGTGKITLTATATAASNSKKKVKTTAKLEIYDPKMPTGIELTLDPTQKIDYNNPIELEYALLPEGAEDDNVEWKVSPDKLAKVEDGKLVPLGVGKITLTATSSKNKKAKASAKLEIYDPKMPTGIEFKFDTTQKIDYNNPIELEYALLPEGAEDDNVEWKVSPDKLAKIEDGKLVPLGVGKITLTATSSKNKKAKASVKLEIYDPTMPTKIVLDYPKGTQLCMDETLPLSYALEPAETAVSGVIWSVSPANLATIEDDCLVPLRVGKVTLTATSDKNPKIKSTASIEIVQGPPIADLRIDPDSITTLSIGSTLQLKVIATFDRNGEQTEGEVPATWKTSNKKFLTVDANSGLVTAVAEGTATMTATVKWNKKTYTARCTLTAVKEPVPVDNVQVTMDGVTVGSDTLTVFGTSHVIGWTFDGDAEACILNVYDDSGAIVTSMTCKPMNGPLTYAEELIADRTYSFQFGVKPLGKTDDDIIWVSFNVVREDTGDFAISTLSDGSVSIDGYTGTDALLEIPADLNGKPVTRIDDQAFMNNAIITEVVIPSSVTYVGSAAFSGCTNLTKVSIAANITKLEDELFKGCSALQDVDVPMSVEIIGQYAFMNCTGLTAIELPDGVREIQKGAFKQCTSLANIQPKS